MEEVIVVSGLPRSGTSMMMQLLDAGGVSVLTDEIRAPDEDNPRGYYEFERVKELGQEASWLRDARGKAVKMVYRLLYDLPAGYGYKVIFMRRPLEEVIASQDEMLQRLGQPSTKLSDERLAEIYGTQLREVEEWLARQPHFSVLYVNYRDVLEDPQPVIQDIDRFLGGGLDTAAMSRVPDASLYRQRVTPQS